MWGRQVGKIHIHLSAEQARGAVIRRSPRIVGSLFCGGDEWREWDQLELQIGD